MTAAAQLRETHSSMPGYAREIRDSSVRYSSGRERYGGALAKARLSIQTTRIASNQRSNGGALLRLLESSSRTANAATGYHSLPIVPQLPVLLACGVVSDMPVFCPERPKLSIPCHSCRAETGSGVPHHGQNPITMLSHLSRPVIIPYTPPLASIHRAAVFAA